jgi:hypothetical protein
MIAAELAAAEADLAAATDDASRFTASAAVDRLKTLAR